MKKAILGLLLLSAWCAAAEPMGKVLPVTNYLEVTTAGFKCTFFPKHMFPVWFKTPEGKAYPEIVRFLDRAVIDRTAYWLYADLWAEQQVLVNTESEFAIRCTGVYCHVEGDKVAPGGLKAVYTYEFRKDSPTIRITADITRTGTEPMNLVFLQPAWSMKLDFDEIRRNGKRVNLSPGHGFQKAKSATFVKDGLAVTVNFNNSDPIVWARYKMKDGFSSILTFLRTAVTGKRYHLTGYLTVSPVK